MEQDRNNKIALAATDLTETDESILAIALKYGYDSHEGFTRSFRAQMGISPKDYRKYHLSVPTVKKQKEKTTMTDSKTIDEIIRSLNNLIVQIREVTAYTRKNKTAAPDTAVFYSEFWDTVATGADAMADELGAMSENHGDHCIKIRYPGFSGPADVGQGKTGAPYRL